MAPRTSKQLSADMGKRKPKKMQPFKMTKVPQASPMNFTHPINTSKLSTWATPKQFKAIQFKAKKIVSLLLKGTGKYK